MNDEVRKKIAEMTDEADALLFGSKDQDYNSGSVDISDMFPFGWYSAYTFMNKHLNRLLSLYSPNAKEPNHESIKDNWLDLLNYVRLGYAILSVKGELEQVEGVWKDDYETKEEEEGR